ncbi:MAG: hypothetical protein ACRDI3_05380 [Actinomycetota bacterium]
MLDRALGTTARNFSTLFLIGAVTFIPLHVAHAFLFRNVLSVAELRPDIADFPEGRLVRNVGVEQLNDERSTLGVLLIVEAGISLLLLGAARRVVEVDADGGVPTVTDAYEHAAGSLRKAWFGIDRLGILVTCAVIGVAAGWLAYRIGLLVTELLGNDKAFAGIGATRGIAVALFLTFVIGPAATLSLTSRPAPPAKPLDVY